MTAGEAEMASLGEWADIDPSPRAVDYSLVVTILPATIDIICPRSRMVNVAASHTQSQSDQEGSGSMPSEVDVICNTSH